MSVVSRSWRHIHIIETLQPQRLPHWILIPTQQPRSHSDLGTKRKSCLQLLCASPKSSVKKSTRRGTPNICWLYCNRAFSSAFHNNTSIQIPVKLLFVSRSHIMSEIQFIGSLKPMSKQDWDRYQDQIQHWYINDDLRAKDVIKRLEDFGFAAKYVFLSQIYLTYPNEVAREDHLTYRLRTWNARKNLTKNTAIYLNNQLKQRKQAGKKSTTVIASGKRLSEDKIKRAVRRHMPPKWTPGR